MSRPLVMLVAVAGILAAAPLGASNPDPALGLWSNPATTIAVQTVPCGQELCGSIVRATDSARADAKDAGVDPLIGTELLQNYRAVGIGVWEGRVYVPDIGRSFSSRMILLSADTLKISGCLIGRFVCRSQLWHRIR